MTTRKKTTTRTYRVIGAMSGSSLDGLDLARCTLRERDGRWTYRIEEARTVPYPPALRQRLLTVMQGSATELAALHVDLGHFIGTAARRMAAKADLLASHGHTIFHQPAAGLTTQIGSGAVIAARSGLTTVCDFRTTDVALGGQGAPLVPLGERLLFPSHQAFLNIGGICNISLHDARRVTGYDVCIGNQALDFLANLAGKAYDRNGALARRGTVHPSLLRALNALPFHHQPPPRSLGREWFQQQVLPLIRNTRIPVESRLCTVVEHIAQQLGRALQAAPSPVFTTGGGAHHGYLIERIRAHSPVPVHVPAPHVVDNKEALVFALLGVLRMRGEATALASVTGAKRDSVGGAVYFSSQLSTSTLGFDHRAI